MRQIFSIDFRKIIKDKFSWKSIHWELSFSMPIERQPDGLTDITRLIVDFLYFVKALVNYSTFRGLCKHIRPKQTRSHLSPIQWTQQKYFSRSKTKEAWRLTLTSNILPFSSSSTASSKSFSYFLFLLLLLHIYFRPISHVFSFSGWLFALSYPSVCSAAWRSCCKPSFVRLIDCIRYANVGGPTFEQWTQLQHSSQVSSRAYARTEETCSSKHKS
jgi:hypothetical protein